jgi:hypothetical protein
VQALREQLGIAAFDPSAACTATLKVAKAAERLQICIGSVLRLIHEGILPATQLMPLAPWQIPAAASDFEVVKIGVRAVKERCLRNRAPTPVKIQFSRLTVRAAGAKPRWLRAAMNSPTSTMLP